MSRSGSWRWTASTSGTAPCSRSSGTRPPRRSGSSGSATCIPGTSGPTDVDVSRLIARLKRAHPDATCALRHGDPFQLLVATILSAQCTDERVNVVTPPLFARFPDARAMKDADSEELEGIIRSTGFYRNKAKSIRGAAERIVEAYGGEVPETMDGLLTLPGVARKTANVVLGVGYGVADGIVVDTHVGRLTRRLGLSRGKTAGQVEQDLMKIVPRSEWIGFAHLLIFHGRRICAARNPKCGICPVREVCPSAPLFLGGKAPRAKTARAKIARAKAAARPARRARAGAARP
ncbi:MAG: endonuclease III [Candidatus Rokubacteria bacterium]|nr:endonuclease III [Candidatus Rokubacteria bacterium]